MISAVIIARDEANNIARCIQSLLPVADEILVLDTGSNDNTRAIAEAAGAATHAVTWQGYAATKNEGYTRARYDYILSLDADEALSETLQKAILNQKSSLRGAYSFNRLTFYGEKAVRHCGWYPDVKVRLFHTKEAKWEGAFVHETLILKEGVEKTHLKGDLLHYSIKNKQDHIARAKQYAQLAGQKMHAQGKRYSWLKAHASPLARFIRMYMFKGGFLDGAVGWKVCWISAKAVYWRYQALRDNATSIH
ncbi:MAG: glycosyltransferase family 2 protein [Bacteroidia bacterium]